MLTRKKYVLMLRLKREPHKDEEILLPRCLHCGICLKIFIGDGASVTVVDFIIDGIDTVEARRKVPVEI